MSLVCSDLRLSPSLAPSHPPSALSFSPHYTNFNSEYYFSPANLAHDTFLKSKMDRQGYVPLSDVSTFRRLANMRAAPHTVRGICAS